MLKHLLAAALATALVTAPLATAYAQATAPATEKKAKAPKVAKPLTPQQQKMKDCSVKWKEEKAAKKVSGRKAHNAFMSTCLKGSA